MILMDDRESALEHFRSLDAHLSYREINGTPVLGVQLRNRLVSDADLYPLRALRDEIDVVGLAGTNVTDRGLRNLLDLPALDNVDLANTAITDEGLEILGNIKSLEYVHIDGTAVSERGVARLQRLLPNCEIVWD